MARVNVEDSLFRDFRFQNFIIKRGSRKLALADMVEAWVLAQRFWVPQEKLIPEQEFVIAEIDLKSLLETGLAEKRDSGIYIKGTKDAFGWLAERSQAGRKGGLKRAEKIKENKTLEANASKLKQTVAKPSKSKQPKQTLATVPSYSYSSSYSFSSSSSDSSSKGSEGVKNPTSVPDKIPITKSTWDAYEQAFEKTYGHAPKRNRTVNAQMKNFVSRLGQADAPLVAEFYLSHKKAYYVQNRHPVGAMLKDAEALYSQWKSNTRVTNAEARLAEDEDFYENQLRQIAEGKL